MIASDRAPEPTDVEGQDGEPRNSLGVALPRKRKMCYAAFVALLFFGAVEAVAWFADAVWDYRHSVVLALEEGQLVEGPILALRDSGLPPRTVDVRVPYEGKLSNRPYVVGRCTVPGSRLGFELSTRRVTPEDLDRGQLKRIFAFGGSAAFGFPYPFEHAFTSILDDRLRAHGYGVWNCAACGWTSGRVVPVLRRVVDYFDPDTVILMTGNNEMLHWAIPGVPYQHFLDEAWISQTYLGLWRQLSVSRAFAAAEYVALKKTAARQLQPRGPPDGSHPELVGADYALRHPLEQYTEFDAAAWFEAQQRYLDAYEANLREMVLYAKARDVRVILSTMPFNYKLNPAWACPQPESFAPEHRQVVRQNIRRAAQHLQQRQFREALSLLDEALALDPLPPILNYLRGECLEQLGQHAAAAEAYAACRENMIGHLGSRRSINERIRTVATSLGAELLDAQQVFDRYERSQGEYYSRDVFHDDCHPTPLGHRLIAEALAERFVDKPSR